MAEKPTYWQIAAGAQQRDYSRWFIKYGIACFGKQFKDKIKEFKENDVIILRNKLNKIIAIGKVERRNGDIKGHGNKEWLKDFDGWNLPSYIYVRWNKRGITNTPKGLCRGTICRINKPEIIEIASNTMKEFDAEKIDPEPIVLPVININKIAESLIKRGLEQEYIESFKGKFSRIVKLAEFYHNSKWENFREHEIRTFLIIPLLLALGWSEKQIKIELATVKKRRIDIACFKEEYNNTKKDDNNENCCLIIESKGFSKGLDYAEGQAAEYAKGFENCNLVITSNGFCYKAYKKLEEENSEFKLKAYLNILHPREKFHLDNSIGGCIDMLTLLLPSHYKQKTS